LHPETEIVLFFSLVFLFALASPVFLQLRLIFEVARGHV
jgi:hypothetical protein